MIRMGLPMELRLLLSPDSDSVSPPPMPFTLDVEVAMLAGRDKRFSRSTSDRSGRLGSNSSVSSNTGAVPPTGAESTAAGSLTGCSFSDGGVDVIGANGVVYHWQFAIGSVNESRSICEK